MPAHLHFPKVDERTEFGAGLVGDARRFERFLDWDWVAATLAALVAYVVMVRRGRVLAGRLGLTAERMSGLDAYREQLVGAAARDLT